MFSVIVMVRKKLIVESSVACKVGTRSLPQTDWAAIVRHLTARFDFVVSPLTFLEVVRSMALGGEQFIIEKLARVEALSPASPLKPVCLEMPGQFILQQVLQCSPILETYQPSNMSNDMVTLLRHKRVTPQLRDWLASAAEKLNSGRETFVRRRKEIQKLGNFELNAEKWLQSKFKHLGIVQLTEEEVSRAKGALSAALEYEAWLTRQSRNQNFSLSKEKTAWVDCQQLLYLSDPEMHILCDDKDFLCRSGASPQNARLLRLPDVVSEARELATSA